LSGVGFHCQPFELFQDALLVLDCYLVTGIICLGVFGSDVEEWAAEAGGGADYLLQRGEECQQFLAWGGRYAGRLGEAVPKCLAAVA